MVSHEEKFSLFNRKGSRSLLRAADDLASFFEKKSTIVMVTHVTKDHSRGNRLWPHFIVVVVQKATCVLQTLERTRQHPTSNQQVRQVSTFLYLQLINAQKR